MIDATVIVSVLGLGIIIGIFIGIGIAFALGMMIARRQTQPTLEEAIPDDFVARVAEIMAQKMEVK